MAAESYLEGIDLNDAKAIRTTYQKPLLGTRLPALNFNTVWLPVSSSGEMRGFGVQYLFKRDFIDRLVVLLGEIKCRARDQGLAWAGINQQAGVLRVRG